MRSYWSVSCHGPSSRIILKKIERSLCIKAIEAEFVRVILNEKKLEIVDFFIHHPEVEHWNDLVLGVLSIAQKFQVDWSLRLHTGHIAGSFVSGAYGSYPIAGLMSVSWLILEEQNYQRTKILPSNVKNMW